MSLKIAARTDVGYVRLR